MRAEDRLEWARRMFEKGYVSMATKVSEELNFKKAQFTLEQAQSKKKVLVKYTKEKTIKELESEVKKAHSDELAKQATWELEKGKETKLEKQIANCTLGRPDRRPGRLRQRPHPDVRQQPVADRGRRDGPRAAEGHQHPRHQPDAGQRQGPRVADRHDPAPSLKAQIRVDAFADQQLTGTVTEVAPLPDPGNFFSSDIKVYTTRIRIDDPERRPPAGHDRRR